jgi:large subunit ribosomal protein L25
MNKARKAGRVPAVVYGGREKATNLELHLKDLEHVMHGAASENLLVDLDVSGKKRLALLQTVQHHVLSGKPLHVDFHEVKEDEKVTIQVPVESTGEAAGVKNGGGTLEHVIFKLKVRALPKDLPEVIVVDVSKLEIGNIIHIGDIPEIPGVEFLGDKKLSVFAVAAPLTEAQETAAADAAGGAAQPEMLKEKKDDAAAGKAGDKAPAAKGGDKAAAGKAGDKAADKGGDKKAAEKKK